MASGVPVIAYATGARLLGVPSCDAWAAAIPPDDRLLAVVLDAKVKAVYLALYPGLGTNEGALKWSSAGQHQAEVEKARAAMAPLYAKFVALLAEALAKDPQARHADAGEMLMMPPTYLTCLEVGQFPTPADVFAAADGRTVEMFMPAVEPLGDGWTLSMPDHLRSLGAERRS